MVTPLARTTGRRGGPLVMLLLLLGAWAGTRALWWENPFAVIGAALGQPLAAADPPSAAPLPVLAAALSLTGDPGSQAAAPGLHRASSSAAGMVQRTDPQRIAARQSLWLAALREPDVHSSTSGRAAAAATAAAAPAAARVAVQDAPSFLPATPPSSGDRLTLDAWAFWRQGSDAAPISQGRVPIYGASQIGATLQYRLAPDARRDPRLYARAYRALVRRGEQELALGISARPVGPVPLRVAAEVRYTDAAFTDEVRPSAYAVTEFPPVALPLGLQLDAYGQAGWVGGASATAFADGQASVTRDIPAVTDATDNVLRLSVGAGAWGGAQTDAQRFDIGPTLRMDLKVGAVPARLSIDWRERIGGQAGPDSGLAATLSTRF